MICYLRFWICLNCLIFYSSLIAQKTSGLVVANDNDYTFESLSTNLNVFSDRTYTFSEIPSHLKGRMCLKTSMKDKFFTETHTFIRFHIDRASEVFVAYDTRYKRIPVWLSSFHKTAFVMTVRRADGTVSAHYQLYSKKFPKGYVNLGGNLPKNEKGNFGMYSVIVTPQSDDLTYKVTFESIECTHVDEIDNEADIIGNVEIFLKNEKENRHIYPFDGNNIYNTVFNSEKEKDRHIKVPEGSKKSFNLYKYYRVNSNDLPYAKLHVKGTLVEFDGTSIPVVNVAHMLVNGNDNLGSHDLIIPIKNVNQMIRVGSPNGQAGSLGANYSYGPIYSDGPGQKCYVNVLIEPLF